MARALGQAPSVSTLCEPLRGVRLRPDQEQKLAQVVAFTGLSRAELIREAVDDLITKITTDQEIRNA
jgi:hypothetical protein